MKTTRLLAASACLLLAVSLSACSKETEKPRATATPSAAPATSEPSKPQDAESAIRAWLDAMIDMQNTGDTKPFLALSTRDCTYCNDFSERVAGVYASGGTAKISPMKITYIGPTSPGSETEFLTQLESGRGVVTPKRGATPENYTGGRESYIITVYREGNQWLIADCFDASPS